MSESHIHSEKHDAIGAAPLGVGNYVEGDKFTGIALGRCCQASG